MSNSRKQQNNDLSKWILPIFFLVAIPPIGVLLLVLKLLDSDRKPFAQRTTFAQQEAQSHTGARTSAPRTETVSSGQKRKKTAKKKDALSVLAAKGKKLTTIGTVLTILCGFIVTASLGDVFYWLVNGEVAWFVQDLLDLLPFFCGIGGGLGCLWAGLRKNKLARRFRTYLNMIGRNSTVSISALASASGRTPSQVREDLEDMLAAELFPAGYLDYGGDMLVLSGDGLRAEAPKTSAAPKSEPSREDAILSEIRDVNDQIANEKLSAQIDRIGVITAKILDYQKSHPEKAPQLHSFLSYYLPTTLKILRAYGRLEAQEVTGQNITAAMARIEGMMDKVVEGFEKQLDQLFQGDTMDITTDVEVLERMLAKDGLSDSRGMTLGL